MIYMYSKQDKLHCIVSTKTQNASQCIVTLCKYDDDGGEGDYEANDNCDRDH